MTAGPLDRLFAPRSIAVIGASTREEAIGFRVIRNLRQTGFAGEIFPVNPRYAEIAGLPCLPSVDALPDHVEAAFIAIPAAQGPQALEEVGTRGIRAAFVNASGFADGGPEGQALQQRLAAVAAQYGIALCGPNNMGLINVHDRIAIWTQLHMTPVTPGPVAVISQSGSITLVLAQDERKLGLAYLVTAGNEATIGVADYLDHIARDPRVRTILVFIESIRNPRRFGAAADEARRLGKRVIAIKTGASERGKSLVAAHTDSLAGDDAVYDAFFRGHGVIRVHDIDEMLETALLVSAYPEAPERGGVVPVTLSGGEAALIADLASDLALPLEPLSEATISRLRPAFPAFARPQNPLDAWGLGFNAERFGQIVDALRADDEIGTIVVSIDCPAGGGGDLVYAREMARHCAGWAGAGKPIIFLNNTTGAGPNPEVKSILDPVGIPYLSGMRTGLAAIAHWLGTGNGEHAGPGPSGAEDERAVLWREALRGPAALGPSALFDLLREAGVPMSACRAAATADEAVGAAEALGYPVALKGSAPQIAHKTELGLVHLSRRSSAQVREAFGAVEGMLRAHAPSGNSEIVLQPMAPPGVELVAAVRSDPLFGAVLVVGLGGVFVEFIKSVSTRLGAVDVVTAREMLRECRAAELLAGLRGKGPFDEAAAAEAIAALSRFGAAAEGAFGSIEINPLIVGAKGAVGVDALLTLRASDPCESRSP